ncbi:uncharacterized protein LOC109831370 [Asparagus officinalis]|uniref:uncharacterized protein LOC109831370 n=1 Tax=Asparagus officinalis TaxID=4686 RepID=UPI00098E57FD|nr:uncharacterized protein LOC109831370 [Asparagus officinalis]
MGTAIPTDKPDINIIKDGPCLDAAQASKLSAPISRDEIKNAVFSINDNKAPGPDGFSASFYKASWAIIGEEVTMASEDFFRTGKLLGAINSTSISLIPKVICPKSPSDFRPISCCNCLYKFISKIIANRVQSVIGYLISEAQSAFVKGRNITNNIMLAHELIKNYGRKHISPRIMLNIDIRKAFDTISWSFIEEILSGLGFPSSMIKWIMVCISSPKYSISLNGSLHGYFKGERGLRQGDPLSPYLFILGMEYLSRSLNQLKQDRKFKYHPKCGKFKISHLIFADDLLLFSNGDPYSVHRLHQCISKFSATSGLEANPNKCSIFYGGVENSVRNSIHDQLGFSEEIFYGGKNDHASKTSLVSWDKICLGKIFGGLGIYSAVIWNNASALRTLWYIHINKESLWIKWVHETYLKHRDIWQVEVRNGDSWMWKQLLKVRDKMLNLYGGAENLKLLINSCYNAPKVHLSSLYKCLCPITTRVQWHSTVWENLNYPKHSFVLWLAVQNRLLTQDKLIRRGIIQVNSCSLCAGAETESRDHLFFKCDYSREVWNGVMDWLKYKWRACEWNLLMDWYNCRLKGKGFKQRTKRMALAATVYCIWKERNSRIFKQKVHNAALLIRSIKIEMLTVILNNSSLSAEFKEWSLSL